MEAEYVWTSLETIYLQPSYSYKRPWRHMNMKKISRKMK